MTPDADLKALLEAWSNAGLSAAHVADIIAADDHERVILVRSRGGELAAHVWPAYNRLAIEAQNLAPILRHVRTRSDARRGGPKVVDASRRLEELETQRFALSHVLISLRRLGAIADVPAADARIAATMPTLVARRNEALGF